MEDVVTDIPPPSRFFQEDLDNFATPSPPLPPPFLAFSDPNTAATLRTPLLLIAISKPALHLLHHLSNKTLIGTLLLPEIPLSGNSLIPSLRDASCNIYALATLPDPPLLISVQYSVSPERSRTVVKAVLGRIVAEKVVVLDSIRGQNFRGRMSADETLAFKLETSEQRITGDPVLKGVEYLPTGSVMDGLGAAVLGECQMRKVKGTLLGTWPDAATAPVVAVIGSCLVSALPGLRLGSGVGSGAFGADSDLYT